MAVSRPKSLILIFKKGFDARNLIYIVLDGKSWGNGGEKWKDLTFCDLLGRLIQILTFCPIASIKWQLMIGIGP